MRLFNITKKICALGMLSFFFFSVFGSTAIALEKAAPASGGVDCTKEYCPLTTVPGAYDACSVENGVITCVKGTVKNPVDVIKNIYGITIGIGAILAVIMIIWAGVEYTTTESITGHSDAKEKWQGALFGLLVLLSSYIVLRTINPDLVNINLDLGKPIKGSYADPDTISNIIKAANNSALAVVQAEKKSAETKKILEDLKLEKTRIDTALLSEKDPGNIAAYNKQLDEINKKLNEGTTEAKSASTDKVIAEALYSQNLILVEQKTNIERHLETGIDAAKTLNRNYTLTQDRWTQRAIIEAHRKLSAEYSVNSVKLQSMGSTKIQEFQQRSREQLDTFDLEISQLIGCGSGMKVTLTSVTCN